MRNCFGFLSHTYCQVKALGITYFVYPHIYGVGKVEGEQKKVYNRFLGWRQYHRPECFKALK